MTYFLNKEPAFILEEKKGIPSEHNCAETSIDVQMIELDCASRLTAGGGGQWVEDIYGHPHPKKC